MIKFGTAGNPDRFHAEGYKASVQMPAWLKENGLTAYEYQCGNGVRITDATAKELGAAAQAAGITLSLHSPYYISLSSVEEEKRKKSVDYILASLKAADAMGATRVVVHSGSCAKIDRKTALAYAKETMKMALAASEEAGFSHIALCPETMGKINQLGTLEEVLELCQLDERMLPTVDFGHLYARSIGGLTEKSQFVAILDAMENALGWERARRFHCHFSPIEYTGAGEKKHLTFAQTEFGPDFTPLGELLAERDFCPTIISESAGAQADDAMLMRDIYLRAKGEL